MTATGTANTVTVRSGQLLGESAVVDGMLPALLDSGGTHTEAACVLGAGATAATVLAVLHTLGCREGTAVARDTSRTRELVAAGQRIGISQHEVHPRRRLPPVKSSSTVGLA